MSEQPDSLSYNPDRVIRRLSEQLADAAVENAKLHDVIATLLEQQNAAARQAESATASEGAGPAAGR